ncbi:lantibiotic dehydratase [Kutzneria chonburiensis]|uniref:Lantibiotic dehydratase n=1 Tax=Kutzneria chonburiensis TaxID=1483604 RepID=A0ABV6N7D8_9PSEU|nr:lantibiotic dehydratase [Kutzneria chonburiensis]
MANPMYRALDWAMVRTPLLPARGHQELDAEDPVVRQALAVGAGDLVPALEKSSADPKARDKVAAKLARYLIRMSTRSTPYGMFAGVGLTGWGDRTDLALTDERPRTRTRPDMGWLLELVAEQEARPEVRQSLRWWANPTAIVHADRVFLAERASPGESAKLAPVTLRATGAVKKALAAARTPIPYGDLVDELVASTGAPTDKVEWLLTTLWEQSVLITDLRPGPTCVEPTQHVADRLDLDTGTALRDLLAELHKWDELSAEEAAAAYPKLLAAARSLHEGTSKSPLQTDMASPFGEGTLNRSVAADAAKAAELLLRMSPAPLGPRTMHEFRERFVYRYGTDRDVPLLELIHPEIGIGLPKSPGQRPPNERRDNLLRKLAVEAIRNRRMIVELDDTMIATLETWDPANAPDSVDVTVFVVAESTAAIDRGDFQVVVGPNVGAQAAGRTLGRFTDLLGEPAREALLAVDEAERRPDVCRAEVTYLPLRDRLINVTIRPQLRERELPVNVVPGTAHVPLDELVVGVRKDRIVLWWPARDVEVVPSTWHMLNTANGNGLVRFLEELARSGTAQMSSFDWGPATQFPFLPRVQCGRIVLAPASWRLSSVDELADWDLPRHVYLAQGDNRLLIDLHDPEQVKQLSGKQIVLEEALPALEHAWLDGPTGGHLAEIVVPLVLARPERPTLERKRHSVSDADRMRMPGDDWFFLKLYHLPSYEDDLLAWPLRELRDRLGGLADNWFFMRYVDPDPHLRIRWHGDPDRLLGELAPEVMRWAAGLVRDGYCHRFMIDTYEREVERYGGVTQMPLAEGVFGADSDAVVDLLHLVKTDQLTMDRSLLAANTVDDLLSCLGFEPGDRAELYRTGTVDRNATGKAYRELKGDLITALTDPTWLDPRAVEILARRRARIAALGGEFDLKLARSYVHMHCNRLLACGHPPEQNVLGLLARTRETLAHIKKAKP